MDRRRKIVKVTRRGQTTIPIEFRKRHQIAEGSRLVVEDRGDAVALDIGLARDAGFLRCVHRDLPMADCVIAATALRVEGRVVTNDPHFAKVKGLRTTWI